MFDKIKGPADQYRGPATGDSTEHGDSWHAAVAKINANFERLFTTLKGGAGQVQAAAGAVGDFVDAKARAAFEALRTAHEANVDHLGELEQRVKDLEDKLEAMIGGPLPAEQGVKVENDPEASLDAVSKALNAG